MKHFFVARFLFCAFFTVLFFANAPAQDCNSYPDCLDKGLNALKTRNASKAKDYFKDAKKYARKGDDKGNKDEAKSLREVADDYGDNYFKELSKSADYQKLRNFKNLVMLYQASIQKFDRVNRRDVADLLKPVDEQLRKMHNEESQKFEKIRKDEVEKAFQSGKKLLSVSPTEAITQLEWIKTQAYSNEMQQMKVDALLTDAYYNGDLQRGKHEASSGDLEKALATYQKAQNRKNTPEATALVKETRSLIYQKHFKAGNDQALAKQYEKAHKSFLKSKEYTDDASEVNARINYWYENLYSEGQKAYSAEKFQEALNIYKNAAVFNNSTQLQTAQKEANHGLQLKSARELMAKGEVNNAIQATDRALGFVKSQEATDLKNRLNNHLALLQTAEQQFSSGNMAEAANGVAKAKELVPVSNNAYSVQQKIESTNKSIEQAQQLKKSDPLRALPFARAAQNQSNNQHVQKLIEEINQNMFTTVTFVLQGHANCSINNAYVAITGNNNYKQRVKYQQGGVSCTINIQGDFHASLDGLGCPESSGYKDLGNGVAQSPLPNLCSFCQIFLQGRSGKSHIKITIFNFFNHFIVMPNFLFARFLFFAFFTMLIFSKGQAQDCLKDAQNYAQNGDITSQEHRDPSVAQNTETVVTIQLMGYANCDLRNAYYIITGRNRYKKEVKYQSKMTTFTVEAHGYYSVKLKGVSCPEDTSDAQGDSALGAGGASDGFGSGGGYRLSAEFTCQGNPVKVLIR